jgi:plasmid maintenance system antidote protein VapI
MTKKLRAVHPGDILRHDFMDPLGLSAYIRELAVVNAQFA